jgi:hypothetical protein
VISLAESARRVLMRSLLTGLLFKIASSTGLTFAATCDLATSVLASIKMEADLKMEADDCNQADVS